MSEIRSGSEQDRNDNGQFLPGVSGNPAGRTRGIKDRRVKAREDLLGPILPRAVEKLAAAVDEGEKWAIEIVVGYSIPKPRPVDADEIEELEQGLKILEDTRLGRKTKPIYLLEAEIRRLKRNL